MHVHRFFALVLAVAAAACAAPRTASDVHSPAIALPTGTVHDFDWLTGTWNITNRKLKVRGVGSNDWEEFPSVAECAKYLGNLVHVDELRVPSKGWSGLSMHTFDLEKRQWSLYWIGGKVGKVDPPLVGGFAGERGEFYGDDVDDGRRVKVKNTWLKSGPDTAHWEQAYSYDGGKSWETNWISELVRAPR